MKYVIIKYIMKYGMDYISNTSKIYKEPSDYWCFNSEARHQTSLREYGGTVGLSV